MPAPMTTTRAEVGTVAMSGSFDVAYDATECVMGNTVKPLPLGRVLSSGSRGRVDRLAGLPHGHRLSPRGVTRGESQFAGIP